MTKKRATYPYYCTKCKSFHKDGETYNEHIEYNAEKIIQNVIKKYCQFVSEDIVIPKGALQIEDFESTTLINKIDALYNNLKGEVDNSVIPYLDIPLRRRENIIYNDQNQYFLGKETRKIKLGDKYDDFLRILFISTLVKELRKKDLHATKREIFYTDVYLFKDQKFSDISIEDLAAFLATYRDNLHIVSSARGHCLGKLKITDNRDIIDFENLGSAGWYISPLQENIEILESDAEFILVLEKEASLMRLAESKFWNTVPCILITAHGSPNYSTRSFLKKLVLELKIPIFGLADSDPYGLNILMTYAYGSVQSAHETSRLAVNNIYWLGVMPKDLEEYKIPDNCTLPINNEDRRKIEYMLKEPPILKHDKLREQLELMFKMKRKAETQVLSIHGFDFIIDYIIDKIERGDFIKF